MGSLMNPLKNILMVFFRIEHFEETFALCKIFAANLNERNLEASA